ncbi:MAG TPA: hypothetical protein VEH62_05700 [Gemmatimonadales bacterium]|nr:hypothetical protein [Gemmatimonadales bacterium]
MPLIRRSLFPALAVLAAIGCRSAPTALFDDVLAATSSGGAIRLQSRSVLVINYFLLARDASPLIDWAPCAGPGCPAIPAGGTVDVPHAQVPGLTAATTEVLTYWWHSVADGRGGFRPDSLRVLIVPL